MNKRLLFIIAAAACLPIMVAGQPVYGDHHGKIRMYKLNKKGQLVRQRWIRDADDMECQNTMKSRQVHRFAQIGYTYCRLFSAENCMQGSEVTAAWDGDKYRGADIDGGQPQTDLLPGSRWILEPGQNTKIESLICSY